MEQEKAPETTDATKVVCSECGVEGAHAELAPLAEALQGLIEPLKQAYQDQIDRIELEESLEDDEDYEDEEDEEEGLSTAADDAEGAEHAAAEDEDLDPEALEAQLKADRQKALAFAEQVLTALAATGDPLEQQLALEHASDGAVDSWLMDLAHELDQSGLPNEGIALARRAGEVLDWPPLRLTALSLQAQNDQAEEARVTVEGLLQATPDDLDVQRVAAEIYQACGDVVKAEAFLRKVLAHPQIGELPEIELETLDELVELLTKLRRGKETKPLVARIEALVELLEAAEDDEEDEDDDEVIEGQGELKARPPRAAQVAAPVEPPPAPILPFRRDAPKVGRNEPCPCGSGKKNKKCCGMN